MDFQNSYIVELEQHQREVKFRQRDRNAIARAKHEGLEAIRKLKKMRKNKS